MRNHEIKTKQILAGLLALSVAFACGCSKKKDESDETRKSRAKKTTVSDTSEIETSEPTELTTETSETSETTETSETQASSSETNVYVPDSFKSSDADSYLDSIDLDGVVLVAENGNISYTRASGYADRKEKISNTMDTVFEFGSITKQFTAVAVMQLVEQGKLSTDDTLDKYVPEYKYAKDITIHQLLNMTSGVPDYLYCGVLGFTMDDFKNVSLSTLFSFEAMMGEIATTPIDPDDLVRRMSDYELDFAPGTEFEYSNTNYYFLGMIIEKLSGMPYDEYVRKNILEPLDLKDLYPDTDHLTSNGRTDMTIFNFDFPHQDASLSYAVGVMTGTAEGLLKWEYKVMERALLKPESWEKVFDGGQFGYGYGWYVEDGYVEHSGMTLGYNTNVRVDLETGRVVIVLCNIQPITGTPKRPMASEIGDKLWGYFG